MSYRLLLPPIIVHDWDSRIGHNYHNNNALCSRGSSFEWWKEIMFKAYPIGLSKVPSVVGQLSNGEAIRLLVTLLDTAVVNKRAPDRLRVWCGEGYGLDIRIGCFHIVSY